MKTINIIYIVILLHISHLGISQEWNAMGVGLNNGVFEIELDAGINVYAGGNITMSGGTIVNNIAKWDGASWSALGIGVNDIVRTIYSDGNGNIYVGGDFTHAGGNLVNHISMWDGSTWTSLGVGVNNSVKTIQGDGNGNIYVGGEFTQAGGSPANHIAKWNGSTWGNMDVGLNQTVYDIEINNNGDVYACGFFYASGSTLISKVARWDGVIWNPVGSGFSNSSSNPTVQSIEFDGNGNLFAGGYFEMADGITVNNVAKWDGSNWSALSAGINGILSDIEFVGGDLYVTGNFTSASGISAKHIAKWDGVRWSKLASGLNSQGVSLGSDNENIYVGGLFVTAGGNTVNSIARWGEKNYQIKSKVFFDANNNNVWDNNENPFNLGKFVLNFGAPLNNSINVTSNASGLATYGIVDSLRIDFNYNFNKPYFSASLSKSFTEFQNGKTDTCCVAVSANGQHHDMLINIRPSTGRSGIVSPGFKTTYVISIENIGTAKILNPHVQFILDAHQTYYTASQIPVSVFSNNLEWRLNDLLPLERIEINLCVVNDTIPVINLGDMVANKAFAYSIINEIDTTNNISCLDQTVTGAYDPNDKNESHNGILSTQAATNRDWLQYNIRFQNTGNDTALNITIEDVLDGNLDGSTAEMINASHANVMSIQGQNLKWTFEDIYLVDSLTNEPLSHGYVHFRIKPTTGLVLNDIIENSASIYFDYNPPIITNTHVTTVSDDLNCLTCKDNALHFDGVDDYVQANSPLTGNSDYTIEAWFYSDNTGGLSAYNRIIGWQNFEMELGDAAGELQFYDGVGWNNTSVNIRDAQWHHVAVTREGENYKVYVDGILELDYVRNNTLNLSGFFRLGSKYNLFDEMWTGLIDDVRLWDHARSADKIMAKRHCSLAGVADGLVLHYSFNQGIAAGNNVGVTTLVDITDGAQNGTLNAFTLMGATSNYVISNAADENYCLAGSLNVLQDHALIYEGINYAYQTSSNYTTIEIDHGDGNMTLHSSSTGFETHQYEIPGLFNVSLLLDGKCVASQKILIETCEWQAYTEDFISNVFDQYHASCTFIHPGSKTAYLDPSATALSDYKTGFINYHAYGVLANDVIYDVLTQNTTISGGLSPHQTELVLVGRNGKVAVTFANDLASTQIIAPGINNNSISGLNINTTNWHTLAIKITNETDIDVFVDNSVVHSFTMSIPLGEVVGLEVNYHGAGTADLIRLSKSPNTLGDYLIENFVSCEQTCPCIHNRHIDYPELAHEVRTYTAANFISGDDVINADAIIVYDAGTAVELQEGFHTYLGAEFDAKIDGCTMYCNSTNPLFDFDFLQPYVGNPLYTITHCKWNGQSVLSINYCNSGNGTDSYFYDCTGHLICHALSPSDPCFTMFNFTNCEVLQGC